MAESEIKQDADQEVVVINGDEDPVSDSIKLETEETDKAAADNAENKDVEMEEKKEDAEDENKLPSIEKLARGMVKISPIVIKDMAIKDFTTLLHKAENFTMEFTGREGEITLNFAPEKPGRAWTIVRAIAHMKLTNKELKVECPQAFAEVIANEKEGKKKPRQTPGATQKKDESESNFVKVSNLPTDTTEETLKGLFADAVKITLEKDDEGNCKGTAALEFSTPEAAKEFLSTNKEVTVGENTVKLEKMDKPKDPFDELKKRWERWSGTGEGKKKKKKKSKSAGAGGGGGNQQAQQTLQRAKQARMKAMKMKQNRMGMGNRFGGNRGSLMGPGPAMAPRQAPFMMNQMEMLANMMNMGSGGMMGGGMMGQMGGMMGGGAGNMMGGGGGGMMAGGRGGMMGGGGGNMMGGGGGNMMGGGNMGGGGGMMQGGGGMMQGGGGRMQSRSGQQRRNSMGQDRFGDFSPDRSFDDSRMRDMKEQQFQHLQQIKQQRGMRGQNRQQMMGSRGFGYEEEGTGNRFRRNSAQGYEGDSMYRSGYNNRDYDDDDDDYMPQNMYDFQNASGKRKSIWDDDNQGRQGGQWGGGFKKRRGGGGGGGGNAGGGGGGGRKGKMRNQQQRQNQSGGGGGGSWKSSQDMWSDYMSNQGASGNYGGYPY